MKKIIVLFFAITNGAILLGQNIFPASGNVGIGTSSPAGLLDVNGVYAEGGYKFMDNHQPNTSVGFLNPIALALRQGRKLYSDEEFAAGVNAVYLYDNNSSGQLTISRVNTVADVPNSSRYCLLFTHSGIGETPGYGGFYQIINSGINKTIVQIFRAKLPVGYIFNAASNSLGTGGANYWLTNTSGTGKWEWYVRVVQSGNGGTFSGAGHIYVSGNPAPSGAAPLIWYMASCTAFDVTDVSPLNSGNISNQNAADQNADFRINGNGVIGGNVLIGKTSQANTDYKLDINGKARANELVVNSTGADFVFDSGYHLDSLGAVSTYIKEHHHLKGIPSATEMQQKGVEVGANETLLLQKMEELTLYIIQLKTQSANQQKDIETLQKQLKTLAAKMRK